MDVNIERASGGGVVLHHGFVDLGLGFSCGAGIADDPEVNGGISPRNGIGFEAVGIVRRGEAGIAVVDRVIVGGSRFEFGESGFELAGVDRGVF